MNTSKSVLDLLPAELIAQIAAAGRDVYWPLAVGYPRFGRSLTAGRRVDYAISFGHDVRVVNIAREYSCLRWTLNGKNHRTDGPAEEYNNGDYMWYKHGKQHRLDGPAELDEGIEYWYVNGVYSATNNPAIRCVNCNTQIWYKDGKIHRDDGPAAITTAEDSQCCNYLHLADDLDNNYFPEDGTLTAWFVNDKLHQEGGPAVEYASGTRIWCINGERHRDDGPAVEFANGDYGWYYTGERHRDDGPARRVGSVLVWYEYRGIQRTGEPAAVCECCGSEVWCNGCCVRRSDGPAITIYPELPGCDHTYLHRIVKKRLLSYEQFPDYTAKYWTMDDRLHRYGAPAIVVTNGDQIVEVQQWKKGKLTKKSNTREIFEAIKKSAELHGLKISHISDREFRVHY